MPQANYLSVKDDDTVYKPLNQSNVMRKNYCPPVAESISVYTHIIAASTDVVKSVPKANGAGAESGTSSSWGSLWE
jgi:hypothetical protein